MPKYFSVLLIIVLAIIVVFLIILVFWTSNKVNPELDSFAKCLTEKGLTMYGTEFCSWCQKEEANFKDAWQFISYVNCQKDPQRCLAVDIEQTPTWVFPDGKKLTGYQGLEKLSKESGCPLP